MPNVFPTQSVDTLSEALGVLTAMITPALLLSASGTFVLSTSIRLGRVIDRVRAIADRMDELMHQPQLEMLEERKAMLMDQMKLLSARATVLQRAITVFYVASGLFVLTSVAIGLDALFNRGGLHWLPVALGISGAFCMLYGSWTLIVEARNAVSGLRAEMRFLNRLVEYKRDL
ncbi:MAG: DUF2721 domain-containing protein [Bryobacterales bacterium]|nr:DUF2721 domain-containing protein [Bryobacterales bacterium]